MRILFTILLASCSWLSSDSNPKSQVDQLFAEIQTKLNVSFVDPKDVKKEFILVDVREPVEQAVSMIKGAITKKKFLENPSQFKGKTIVPYCTIGYRSGLFAKKLQQRGFKALNLKGGILSWVHAKQLIVKDKKPTQTVHVYGKKWNFLPSGFKSVW
jgi:rhodanese-related sulfurtransferase